MEIIIDGIDFFDGFEAAKYWSFPASYSQERRKKEAKEMVFSEVYWGSRKFDGCWLMIVKDNEGNLHSRSRTESVNGGFQDKIKWIDHIAKELDFLPNGSAVIGEIYFPNNEGSRKVTSVFNCLKDKCIERQKKNGWLHYYIFDIIAWDGKSLLNTKFKDRIDLLASLPRSAQFIEFAEYKCGKDLWETYCQILAEGGEGIVIQKEDSLYLQGKRKAKESLKLKKELSDTIDAFLDGDYKLANKIYNGNEIETWKFWFNEKTGEKSSINKFDNFINGEPWNPISKAFFYGWASSVSFSVLKDGQPIHIGYISGIPDTLKEGIVKENDKYKNKVYTLTCMEIEKISGHYSLRHGKIVQERPDKNYKDCLFSQISEK